MSTNSWLLLLGSNHDGETRVRKAILKLVPLGAVRALTPIRSFPADGDGVGQFHNVLVRIDQAPERDELVPRLKSIEDALGRDRDDATNITIDIDILARHDGKAWQIDPHAQDKGELHRAMVQTLLRQAGITVTAL